MPKFHIELPFPGHHLLWPAALAGGGTSKPGGKPLPPKSLPGKGPKPAPIKPPPMPRKPGHR